MKVEIETRDKGLLDYLHQSSESNPTTAVDVPGVGEFQVDYSEKPVGMLPGLSESVGFTLTFASGVAASIVANWLYDKLNCKAERVRIEEEVVMVDIDRLAQLIARHMKGEEFEDD